MKKVAILYSGSKTGGGIDTYLGNLFGCYDQNKVQLSLVSMGSWRLTDRFQKGGYDVHILSGKRFRPKTVFEITNLLRSEGFDLVVSQGVVANAYARLASLMSGVPSLVTIHSDINFDYKNGLLRVLYKMTDLLLRWRTTRYITVSDYLKELMKRSGVPERKISVIYNGVQIPPKLPKKKENRRTMLGSAGRLHSVKNFNSLIEAMHKLSSDGFDLTIWGEGAERPALEKLIRKPGLELSHNVFLPGRAENIWEAFSKTDIYIQPSLSEGFGLTVVEAQLAGLPVIVTPGGSLPELVEDGRTGLISDGFAPEDIVAAVLRYYEDPKLAASCAKKGAEFARSNFDINTWASKTIDAYLEIVVE